MQEFAAPAAGHASRQQVKALEAAVVVLSHIHDDSIMGRLDLTIQTFVRTLETLKGGSGATAVPPPLPPHRPPSAPLEPAPCISAPLAAAAAAQTDSHPADTEPAGPSMHAATESTGGGDTERTTDGDAAFSAPAATNRGHGECTSPLDEAREDGGAGTAGIVHYATVSPTPGLPCADVDMDPSPQEGSARHSPEAGPPADRGDCWQGSGRGSFVFHGDKGACGAHGRPGLPAAGAAGQLRGAEAVAHSRESSPAAEPPSLTPTILEDAAAAPGSLTRDGGSAVSTQREPTVEPEAAPPLAAGCQSSPFQADSGVRGGLAAATDHPYAMINQLRRDAGIVSDEDVYGGGLDTPPSSPPPAAASCPGDGGSGAAACSGSGAAAAPPGAGAVADTAHGTHASVSADPVAAVAVKQEHHSSGRREGASIGTGRDLHTTAAPVHRSHGVGSGSGRRGGSRDRSPWVSGDGSRAASVSTGGQSAAPLPRSHSGAGTVRASSVAQARGLPSAGNTSNSSSRRQRTPSARGARVSAAGASHRVSHGQRAAAPVAEPCAGEDDPADSDIEIVEMDITRNKTDIHFGNYIPGGKRRRKS